MRCSFFGFFSSVFTEHREESPFPGKPVKLDVSTMLDGTAVAFTVLVVLGWAVVLLYLLYVSLFKIFFQSLGQYG